MQKQTTAVPLVRDITSSLQETKKYDLTILNEKLVFNISEFDQDPNAQKEVYAILYVKYNNVCKLKFRIWLISIMFEKIVN